jgi:hypothetical protein
MTKRPPKPLNIPAVIDLALGLTDTCDICFVPDDWLADYLISLAHQQGREVERLIVEKAIPYAREEYLASLRWNSYETEIRP